MSLLFYDRNAGQGELYTTNGQGGINQLNSYSGWRTSWTHIIPCYAVNPMQFITALLFYDSNSGVAQFYNMDGQGNINQLTDTTYSKGWTHIIPSNFTGSTNTVLLFYNSNSGLAQFYNTDGQGNISQLSSTTYSKGWTHIIDVPTGGSSDNLLFYNSNSGLAQFYSTDGQGHISELSNNTYSKGWTHIISGSFGLLFYNSNSGLAQFYSTDGQGHISELSNNTYSKGWTHIVDVPAGQGPQMVNDNLLFYNASSGLAQFYSTNGQGGINQLSSATYRKGWAQIRWLVFP